MLSLKLLLRHRITRWLQLIKSGFELAIDNLYKKGYYIFVS
jgi:hypothetical protein